MNVRERDATAASVGGASACLLTTDAWQRLANVRYRALRSGDTIEISVSQAAPTAPGDSFELDGVSLVAP